jgi:hypothetical protein
VWTQGDESGFSDGFKLKYLNRSQTFAGGPLNLYFSSVLLHSWQNLLTCLTRDTADKFTKL